MKKFYRSALVSLILLSCNCRADTNAWESVQLKNGLIDLQIVPEIGGRILQYKLGDYGFFLVNPDLYNKQPPSSGVGSDNAWLNYGGDKLWLAPQGWDNDSQWPGPPDPVLDGQPYAIETLGPKEIRLTSRKDQRSGVQLSRVIKMFDGSTRVSIDATMQNIDTKPRRWGIWAHTQFNAGNRHGSGYNKDFWAYCPLNKNSIFPKGYDVQYGLVNEMAYKPDYENGIMRVQYQRRVGKIGIDSKAGWVATVDSTDGYVFVHRFEYEQGKAYPDNSSVEIWMNGLGEFVAWGKINKCEADPNKNPYNFESEVISPYARLEPGQKYTFHYEFYSAKIPTGLGIVDCSNSGVICEAPVVLRRASKIQITGKFGVFYEGNLSVIAVDEHGNNIKELASGIRVSPVTDFDLNLNLPDPGKLNEAKAIVISLYDQNKKLIGVLARAKIPPQS